VFSEASMRQAPDEANARRTPSDAGARQSPDGPGRVTRVANTGGQGALLRSGPGTSEPVVTMLAEGTTVLASDDERPAQGRLWLLVRTEDGVEGWIAADLIASDEDP
jgi:hypothetical protein